MKTAGYLLVAFLVIVILAAPGSAQAFNAASISKLSGRILLQVEEHGEAWYVKPSNLLRYYMKDGVAAYQMMRYFGQGITDVNLAKVPHVTSTDEMKLSASACVPYSIGYRFRGQILLQVQQHGEAWYIDPSKCRAIYMADGAAAYEIMRYLGMGITNSDLAKIKLGDAMAVGQLPVLAAISACLSKSNGDACAYSDDDGAAAGTCDDRAGIIACYKNPKNPPGQEATSTGSQYSLAQAMSDKAQLSTIAFSGLAFITGSAGADTFFPPGKVADFFGFQYMRDIDVAGYGHNTNFLSRAANDVLYILNDAQKAKLIALAKEQAPLYESFAYNRFLLTNAFRRNLEERIPNGATGLSAAAVSSYTGDLYKTDADLSYNRALVVGGIINSFTAEQKAYLAKMKFNDYSTWPDAAEDQTLKKGLTNDQFVALMTYASEMFSWYKGSPEADVYFCPERHGSYFGGFFMKDYPAMNDSNYFIDTAITGDSGQGFLDVLSPGQKVLITGIINDQRTALREIAQVRTDVSTELRQAMSGGTIDKAKVYSLIERYGELDGQLSALYATRFAAVKKLLSSDQYAALVKLRNLAVAPAGAYKFSTPVAMPTIPDTDFLFNIGKFPDNAGQTAPSADFSEAGVGK